LSVEQQTGLLAQQHAQWTFGRLEKSWSPEQASRYSNELALRRIFRGDHVIGLGTVA
jgi:hypothetical protein